MSESALERMKQEILKSTDKLTSKDDFQFRCGKHLSCFNSCCADVNISLTPLDILALRGALGITSGEFLDRYTVIPFSSEQTFPVVLLKMRDDSGKTCPFVTERGCSVYAQRPWACRMYPIGVASPAPENTEKESFYFLLREHPCEGHSQLFSWTIEDWIKDQGAENCERQVSEFKHFSLHPFFLRGETLNPAQMDMLVMVLYDLDKFREFVFESSFLKRFKIEKSVAKKARHDDLALLSLGFRWLRFCLFGEKVLEVRDRARRAALGSVSPRHGRAFM